jgi:type II secretory pathway component GspD/PulD (secretin)
VTAVARRFLWCLVALLGAGCLGPGGGDDGGTEGGTSSRVGSANELRDLIRSSSLAPVRAEVATETGRGDPIASAGDGSGALPAPGIPGGPRPAVGLGPQPGGDTLEANPPPLPTDPAADPAGAARRAAAVAQEPRLPGAAELAQPADLGADPTLPGPGLGSLRPDGSRPGPAQNPFLEFGSRIMVRADGRITKPYQVASGKGRAVLQMMQLAAPFPFTGSILDSKATLIPDPRPDPALPELADIVLLENWDFEVYQNFKIDLQSAPQKGERVDLADWLVVTAVPETMRQVESFVELFAARVPQVEVTASIVEVTFSDELDYGVTGPDGSVLFDFPDGTFVDSFSYSLPNSVEGTEGILSIGAIQDGVALNAFLEAIQRWENVSIRTNPRIVVREGGVAEIFNTQEIPQFTFTGINTAGNFNAGITFREVGTKLQIAPRVMGSNTLAMNLFLEASQQIGTAVSFTDQNGNEFRSPVVAKRQARTVVYLEPGQAVAIGGLVSERDEEAESKVPILGDIPLIGFLFRSVRHRIERTVVLFLVTPRVLEGVDFHEEIWDGGEILATRN